MRPARPSEVKERRRLDQKLASAPGMMVRQAIGEVHGTLIQLNIGPAEGFLFPARIHHFSSERAITFSIIV